MSTKNPTQRDLAAACGVSVATVSLALRGHPRISPERRAIIMATAAEMGYRLDPALAHWARQRWRERPESPLIAVLSQRSHMATQISRGARRAAQELGYRLQRFDLGDPRIIAQQLKDLGVRGIMVEAHNDDAWYDDFPFEDFVGVAMGMGARRPPLDLVKGAVFYNTELAIAQIVQASCRRVLFINALDPMSINERMQVGALSAAAESGLFTLLPIVHRGKNAVAVDALPKRLKSSQADCVLCQRDAALHLRDVATDLLKKISVLVLNANPREDWSGVNMCFEDVGARCVHLLDQHLAQHRYGRAAQPVTIEVPGMWHPGKTLRLP